MFQKVINGVSIAAKLTAVTLIYQQTVINKVINTVILNHRRILSEARGGTYCLPKFLAFEF